jgi:hypothetical protein
MKSLTILIVKILPVTLFRSSEAAIMKTLTEAEFLDAIQTKVLKVFLLAIHSHLYSFALRFLFLQTHATCYIFYSSVLYTIKEKGGKSNTKPYPLPFGLRNPYTETSSLRTIKIMPRKLNKILQS